jgi:cytoskeleton protein RodZ
MVPASERKIPVAVRSGRENRLSSFGENLKREREKRAITLEQISLSTKIGTRMLQALEAENFDQLPGGIFNRGFVRAYARHVGLDEEQAIADYLEASGEGPTQKPELEMETMAEQVEVRQAARPRQLPWGLIAAILLVVVLSLLLWSRRRLQSEEPSTASPASSSAAQKAAPEPTPQPQTSTSANHTEAPALVKSDVVPAPPPTTVVAPAARAAVTPKVTAETTATAPDEFTVVILAREDSWLSIKADGKIVQIETLAVGDQRAVHARKEVVVRAGNIGGLDFVFNGKKLPSQGDYGEVKTLTFGSAGLQVTPPILPVSPPVQ